MKYIDCILHSMLDDDLYKFTMGQVVFHNFFNAIVTYEFFNRGKTEFPPGFGVELQNQVNRMEALHMRPSDESFMNSLPYFRRTYVEWLYNYRMDPSEVTIKQIGGDLKIYIKGYWYRTIYWEVKLMAIISELYFKLTGQKPDSHWTWGLDAKLQLLKDNECDVMEFGTRRRFSWEVQREVVYRGAATKSIVGTSNMALAEETGLPPMGTSAHEAIMAMSALAGPQHANAEWLIHWFDFYGGQLGIALTDTYTTDVFLKDFGAYFARLYDGVRQDSGNPYDWANRKMFPHYEYLGISAKDKKFVFSDNLKIGTSDLEMIGNSFNYVALNNAYKGKCRPVGGIGTSLTNDVGVKPLNMVIKMTSVDFGSGPVNVVKLSDELGKNTGDADTVLNVKRELGLL